MLVSFNGTARKVRLTDGRWPYLFGRRFSLLVFRLGEPWLG